MEFDGFEQTYFTNNEIISKTSPFTIVEEQNLLFPITHTDTSFVIAIYNDTFSLPSLYTECILTKNTVNNMTSITKRVLTTHKGLLIPNHMILKNSVDIIQTVPDKHLFSQFVKEMEHCFLQLCSKNDNIETEDGILSQEILQVQSFVQDQIMASSFVEQFTFHGDKQHLKGTQYQGIFKLDTQKYLLVLPTLPERTLWPFNGGRERAQLLYNVLISCNDEVEKKQILNTGLEFITNVHGKLTCCRLCGTKEDKNNLVTCCNASCPTTLHKTCMELIQSTQSISFNSNIWECENCLSGTNSML